jgi:hypothetical protein
VTSSPAPSPSRPWWKSRTALAALAAVVVFAVTAILVWQLDSGASGEDAATTAETVPAGVAATIVSAEQLRSFASGIGRPVYWAGERRPARIEYTQTANGTTYVRYLTGTAEPGDKGSRYVVVATYAQPDAYARVRAVARRNGYRIEQLQNSGIAVTEPKSPRNVHIVYPGLAYQVEVYAPAAALARQIALSGAVAPVG